MEKRNIIQISFLSSVSVFLYIAGVATLIHNIDKIIDSPNTYWGPVMFLMLFVFSALITGLLVLGYPLWLYLDNRKKDAVTLLLYTVTWLFILLIVAFLFGGIL